MELRCSLMRGGAGGREGPPRIRPEDTPREDGGCWRPHPGVRPAWGRRNGTRKAAPAEQTQLPRGLRAARPLRAPAGRGDGLAVLLLVAVLPKPLLPLVGGDLVALALPAAGHGY